MARGSLRLRSSSGSSWGRLLALTFIVWLAFAAYSLAMMVVAPSQLQPSNVVEVVDPRGLATQIAERGVTILYFKQELCPGCAKVEPALMRLASERRDVRLVVAHIDRMLERDPRATLEMLGDFKVLGTPTIIVYVDGREAGRHVSTFGLGDQYKPLKEFVEAAIEGKALPQDSGGVYTQLRLPHERAFEPGYIVASSLTALGLGLVAALSPCSLPMVLAYSLSSRGSVKPAMMLWKAISLGSAALLGGSILVLVYLASSITPVNMYKLLISVSASLLIAWGILTVVEMKHTLVTIPWLTRMLPLLGLQCSLPFLIAMISMLEAAPHIMLLGSIAFTVGYITPYLAASTSLDLARSIESLMRSKILLVAQGVALIAAGAYILYNVKTLI